MLTSDQALQVSARCPQIRTFTVYDSTGKRGVNRCTGLLGPPFPRSGAEQTPSPKAELAGHAVSRVWSRVSVLAFCLTSKRADHSVPRALNASSEMLVITALNSHTFHFPDPRLLTPQSQRALDCKRAHQSNTKGQGIHNFCFCLPATVASNPRRQTFPLTDCLI